MQLAVTNLALSLPLSRHRAITDVCFGVVTFFGSPTLTYIGLEVKLLCHDLAANLTITRSAYVLTHTYIAC